MVLVPACREVRVLDLMEGLQKAEELSGILRTSHKEESRGSVNNREGALGQPLPGQGNNEVEQDI